METEINSTHEAGILEAIQKHPIFSFNDIFVFYKGCSRATAYNHNLDKLDSIKELIYSNRRRGVTTLLSKWLNSENATLQLAAMRLIGESEERQMLNQQYIDHSTKGEKLNAAIVTTMTAEELKESLKK